MNSGLIKISLQFAQVPINRPMKGVKINNYIDNRIVLSSRKLKNEVQALIQSNRPRPLVIRHLNYYEQELEPALNTEEKQTLKAIESKSNKKSKKKSKPNPLNHEANHQSNQKQEKRDPPKKLSLNNKNFELKKKSSQSSPSKIDDENLNSTQKRPRSTSKTYEGLGKRSKSAIIKRHKSPSNVVVQQDLKLNLNLKKQGETTSKKKKSKKDKKNVSGANKTKELKKNLSTLNISEKKKKTQKQSETKTSRPPSKSIISSSAQSKPISAREYKKKETNMVKNLFGPFQKKKEEEKDHITLEQLLNIQKNDFKVKSAIMKLEDAINSKGNRKKLSQKLELLAEKLKEMDNENEKEEQDLSQESEEDENIKQHLDYTQKSVQQFLAVEENKQKQKEQEKQQNEFTNPEIANKLLKNPLMQSQDSEDEYIEVGEEIFEDDIKKEEFVNKEIQAKRQNYIKDPDSKRENLERQHGTYSRNQEQNPLIGRKNYGDPYFDLVDYDSINSVKSNQEEKRLEINQLKKFQQESDMMMKRLKKLEETKKKNEQPIAEINLEQSSPPVVVKVSNAASPRSLQIKNYAFEKYPTIQSARSPKFNSQQIIEVIKLKEKLSTNRHEKLSELVNVMFDKKIVSPKTYSIQMQSLREQQALNHEVLDNYKKHAEQLAQLLSEIKKEKEEISSIDEMIRSQKWNEAMTVIQENEKIAKVAEVKKVYPPLEKINLNKKNEQIEDENQEAVYYSGEDSELSETGIKLIQIENQQQPKQSIPFHENNSSIKIDESNHKAEKKQRGFESNLFFIKEYCIALCEYVRDNHKNNFRKRIGEPMAYNLQELLRSFRLNRDGSIPTMANSLCEDLAYHDCNFHENSEPISSEIFEEFNKQYPSIKYYHKEESQDAMLEGIFLKSIYDALNESIMIEKPGSINGKALPWAHNSKHLKNLKNSLKNSRQQKLKNQQSEDLIFGISIARIIQWGSCLCGFIPDTVELENTEIDEEYINHIRETRTALLLQKMLVDQQASMYRTELEQTEVKICLGQIIFDELAKEIAQEMRKIVLRAPLRNVDY